MTVTAATDAKGYLGQALREAAIALEGLLAAIRASRQRDAELTARTGL